MILGCPERCVRHPGRVALDDMVVIGAWLGARHAFNDEVTPGARVAARSITISTVLGASKPAPERTPGDAAVQAAASPVVGFSSTIFPYSLITSLQPQIAVQSRTMRRSPWLLTFVLAGCTPSSEAPAVSSTTATTATVEAMPASTSAAAPASSGSAVSAEPAEPDMFATHSAARMATECINRTWLPSTCNHAYAAVKDKFPKDAETIQALMRLAVRADAGALQEGGAEVASNCIPEKGDGGIGYACLYVADHDKSAKGKAAHKLACKGAPLLGQVPTPGGTAACDGDKPVTIKPLQKKEADEARGCFACGHDAQADQRNALPAMRSAKACVALRKRLDATQAAFVEKSIEPLCPQGS